MNRDNRNSMMNCLYLFQYGKGNTIEDTGGVYPIYGSNGQVGYSDKYNSIDAPVIGHIGAYAGIVNWAEGKHFVTYNGVICKIKDGVNPRFGYYTLLVSGLRERLRGSTQPFVSYDMLNEVKVYLPDKPCQDNIARVLSNLDKKIELNNKINEELEKTAKLIYDYWFVQFDFPISKEQAIAMADPSLEGKPYKSSGGAMVYNEKLKREIPEGWSDQTVGDVADNLTNTVNPSDVDDSLPYVGLEHIARKQFYLNEWETAMKVNSQKTRFTEGQILFGKLRPYFHKVCRVCLSGICSTDILVIDSKRNHEKAFLGYSLFKKEFVDFTTANCGGTRMPRANWKAMAIYPIVKAPEELLRQFSSLIGPQWKQVDNLVVQNRTLQQLRDWLLPMLMNGQVTVSE